MPDLSDNPSTTGVLHVGQSLVSDIASESGVDFVRVDLVGGLS